MKEPERLAWVAKQEPVCWICGYDWSKFNKEMRRYATHHIERKSHVHGKKEDGTPRYDDRRNFFLACDDCHETKLDIMPHAEQLARKVRFDPKNYDLERWLLLRDPELKAPNRVTQEEVDAALKIIERKTT